MNDVEKRWTKISDEDMRKANPHISHLIGKNMSELKIMFPDAKSCDHKTCEFTDLDHAIFMEHEQHDIDMAKKGMIKIMYRITSLDNDIQNEKIFHWYNGKEWVELKQ